ncbi:protein kinase domain-containing protein [Streptomyces boncukensis]|uniref:Protein kinase n=1 Tax=Streptomyces boncukensis TaxID=2711219 RepID=A0A6G4WXR8_9ACTN|nr:protein kinase [Streptomyces boncukensis]NGO69803.1 protein kinase [Streptomyces boncukensis]
MTEGTAAGRLGPYRLYGELGRGAAGTVHLGRGSPRRGARRRLAAVRALRPELLRDRQLRARIRQEVRTVADTVRSPYVAAPLGCELDTERPWTAVEFVPGVALAELVRQYGPLPEPSLRALGGALARGLAALHAAGVPHRALRPANVLLTADAPRTVDYGTAPVPGSADGTGSAADDILALAALLRFAATARGDAAAPGAAGEPGLPGVPAGLRAVLLRCLQRDPGARPDAAALARALDLADGAGRAASGWLPERYLRAIGAREEETRRLAGPRLFFGR